MTFQTMYCTEYCWYYSILCNNQIIGGIIVAAYVGCLWSPKMKQHQSGYECFLPEVLEVRLAIRTCRQWPATDSCSRGNHCPLGWLGNSYRGCTGWSFWRGTRPHTASPTAQSTAQMPRPVRERERKKSIISIIITGKCSHRWFPIQIICRTAINLSFLIEQ